MDLFIDLGNSEAKWATGEELKRERVQRADSRDLTASLIPGLASLEPPGTVHIASVLQPERLWDLCHWMERNWQIRPRMAVTGTAELGVVNGYHPPERLGVDRWLALLAARALSQAPLLVVDCGTATTLDAMDGDGRHLGGAILPGLRLFHQCLRKHTDIPQAELDAEIEDFATDTAAGIATGAMLATTSAVEAMLTRMRQIYGQTTQCLLTGGMASRVAQYLGAPHLMVPHLVLQGLSLQAGQND